MPNRRFVKKDYLDQKKLLRTAVTGIINLSDYTLSTPEKTLLSRGLSFCPQPTQVDTLDIQRDTLLFNRRLRLKHLFRDQNNTNRDIFTSPTGWTPPVGKSPTLDTYINVTTTEILEHHPAPRKCMNLSNTELAALITLRSNSNLVIKPADKGGAIVLMNKEDYIQEGLRQLRDPKFYREIPRDHTNKNTTEIHKFLLSMKTKKLLPDAHVNFQLNKANASDTEAAFLDLHLSISNDIVSIKIYDKRDDFDFEIVNFPFLDGDVPRSTSYGVYISQLIRFARASSYVADFNTRNKMLTQKLLKQGYRYHKLRKTFSKFYRRYYDLISKFQVGLKSLLRQGLSEPDFYGDLVYKLKKIVGSNNFSAQFIKVISHYKKIGYNINVLQQTACLVVNPITVGNFAFLFNCTPVGRTSDSMMVPT